MTAWVLPDHIADVLPSEARHIENLRRRLLDTAQGFGYELIAPPLLEHLDSLLTGTGQSLDLQTFKLVDQLSGRTLGLRADTTPQAARIDAHLLNRTGVTRLAYCGPVLHTRPERPHASREPLQMGCELFGHAGAEADVEVLSLVVACLQAAGCSDLTLDLADVRLVRAAISGAQPTPEQWEPLHNALAAKDASAIARLTAEWPAESSAALVALAGLYGDETVLDRASSALPDHDLVRQAIAALRHLATQARAMGVRVQFDLADARGYSYYSGARFAIYVTGAGDALARGGRYDEVGAVFGRARPAVGFSLDVKQLAAYVPQAPARSAIRAPFRSGDTPEGLRLQAAVARLRQAGETVVAMLPGHADETDEFDFDRELVPAGQAWAVQALPSSAPATTNKGS